MDVFFYSVVIVGCVLFVKVLIIILVYMCRAKRLQQQRLERAAGQARDSHLYPAAPYSQQSAFVNFEEAPQPVLTVAPGESSSGLLPTMLPPPYTLAVSPDQPGSKPPAYEDIYKSPETTAPSSSSPPPAWSVDAGQECVAPPPTLAPTPAAPAAPTPTAAAPVAPAPTTTTTVVCTNTAAVVEPEAAPTPAAPSSPVQERAEESHATVTPGGGIAIV